MIDIFCCSPSHDVDPRPADERRCRNRNQVGLLRRVAPGGSDLLGTQRSNGPTKFQNLNQKSDRIAQI